METSLTSSLIVFFNLAAIIQGHSMSIHVEPTILLEGGNIEVKCDVSNLKGGSLFIVWFRRGPIGKEVEIGTSGHVNKVFSRTGRYTANQKYYDNSTAQYILNIRDAKTWDSGEIGCRIPNSFEIFKLVSVISPVSNIQLVSKDYENAYQYADGDETTFNEAQIVNVTCKINSSFPQPNISISSGSQDISHLFQFSHRLLSVHSTRWTPSFYYESMAIPRNGELMVRYEMNHQNLTCSALHQGNLLQPVKISILMKLDKYLPKFDCPVKVEARKYQENFKLVCLIHANPGVEDAFVRWKKFVAFTETLLPNSGIGNYRLRVEYGTNETKSGTRLELLIGRMFPQTFRTYQMVASNALGTTTRDVVVMETGTLLPSETSLNNEGQRLRSSAASFLLVVVIIIIVVVVVTMN